MYQPFVAVHVGAGKHSKEKEARYKELCKKASEAGVRLLQMGEKCDDVAVQVAKVLEDSPLTNSGTGSNLNSEGRVECDACIIDSVARRCTCIGAASQIKNPVVAAKHLLDQLKSPPDKYGRAKPTILVGAGADSYAKTNGCELSAELTTPDAQTRYEHWNKEIGDTIGVICCDESNVCVAASSGGVAYKQPGRIGPAAIPGAGVSIISNNGKLACAATTGHGEDIITTQLATLAATRLAQSDDEMIAYKNVFSHMRDHHQLQSNCYVGVLALTIDEHAAILSFAHQTDSMIWGYCQSNSTPKAFASRTQSAAAFEYGAVCAFKLY